MRAGMVYEMILRDEGRHGLGDDSQGWGQAWSRRWFPGMRTKGWRQAWSRRWFSGMRIKGWRQIWSRKWFPEKRTKGWGLTWSRRWFSGMLGWQDQNVNVYFRRGISCLSTHLSQQFRFRPWEMEPKSAAGPFPPCRFLLLYVHVCTIYRCQILNQNSRY